MALTLLLPQAATQYDRSLEQIFRRSLEQKFTEINVRMTAMEGVLGTQEAAISDPAGGATVDAEARAAINDILAALRAHGLIAS